jgi:ribonuclease HI
MKCFCNARNAIPNIQDIEIKSRATMLIPPKCDILKFDIQLDFPTTNNVSEYEVLVTGLRLANDLGIQHLLIRADSQLVARQVRKDFDCNNEKMAEYLLKLRGMPKIFDGFEVRYVPWLDNCDADHIAWITSSRAPTLPDAIVEKLSKPSVEAAKTSERAIR